MANLLGSQPKVIPEFTGLQVNTSVQSLPIPIIYGSPRININLVYYNGFNAILIKQKSGKGLLSGGKGSGQLEYFATVILAIGEGPLGAIQIIYQDQDVWTPATFPTNGATYFNGGPGQTPWSYVASRWPNDSRAYKDTAYYGFANAQLDSSATVPQIDLVLSGLYTGTCPLYPSTISITTGQYDTHGHPVSFIGNIVLGCADADPAFVILDYLTNPTYGATFPRGFLDESSLFTSPEGYDPNTGDAALSTYCQAVGFGWSVVINNVESASSRLERWTKNLGVACVWNGAKLRFIPYWDAYASGNPSWSPASGIPLKYYQPITQSSVTITMNHILQSDAKDKDPITFSRKDPMEVYNTVRLDFRDRTNFFNNVPAEAKDEAHAELYGPRVDNIGSADEFSLSNYATAAATVNLRRNISINTNYAWKMGPLWSWLDPMDVVAIPNPVNYSTYVVVRIISVEDDEEENVSITAEEYPVGSQSASFMPMSQTTPPNQASTNNPPSYVYPPVVFAVPSGMAAVQGFATPQAIFGVSGGYNGTLDGNWGGANIWVSLDGTTYQLLGTQSGPATLGGLAANLAPYSGANPDNSDTLYVNLSESDGTLTSVASTAAAAGATLCCLQDASGFEILAYTTATLVGPYTWALTGLYRGLYGTTPRFFGLGTKFLYVGQDGNFFETSLPSGYVGQTFFVKFQSFNVYQNVEQDLTTVVAWQFIAGSPTPTPPIPAPMAPTIARRLASDNIGSGPIRNKKSWRRGP